MVSGSVLQVSSRHGLLSTLTDGAEFERNISVKMAVMTG